MPEEIPDQLPPSSFAERVSNFIEQPRSLSRYAFSAAVALLTRIAAEDSLGLDRLESTIVGTGVGIVALIGTGVSMRWYENRQAQSNPGQQT